MARESTEQRWQGGTGSAGGAGTRERERGGSYIVQQHRERGELHHTARRHGQRWRHRQCWLVWEAVLGWSVAGHLVDAVVHATCLLHLRVGHDARVRVGEHGDEQVDCSEGAHAQPSGTREREREVRQLHPTATEREREVRQLHPTARESERESSEAAHAQPSGK